MKCVFWTSVQVLSEEFFIPIGIKQDIKMDVGLHVKHPIFLLDFNKTLIFSTNFRKYLYLKFHENPSSGSEFVLTDMTKLNVVSCNFANAPRNWTPQRVHTFCVISRTVSPCFTFGAGSHAC